MGKHGATGTRSRATVLIAAVLVLLGGGGVWAVARSMGGDPETQASSSEASGSSTTGDSGDDANDSEGAGGSSASADASESGEPEVDTAALMDDCKAEVAAQEKIVDATTKSATDWRLHVEAQTKYAAGQMTSEESKAQWAASKKRGPGDIKRYDSAVKAAGSSTGGCATAGDDAPDAEGLEDCTSRLGTLKETREKGEVVHKQWVAHQKMMASKGDMDPDAYMDKWDHMVKNAKKPLSDYATAQKSVEDAPTCA